MVSNTQKTKISKAIIDFFDAWKAGDYKEMVEASQQSFIESVNKNHVEYMQDRFDFKKLKSYEIKCIKNETIRLNKFMKSQNVKKRFQGIFTVKVDVKYDVEGVFYSGSVPVNVISEKFIMKVNPTSVLRRVSQ